VIAFRSFVGLGSRIHYDTRDKVFRDACWGLVFDLQGKAMAEANMFDALDPVRLQVVDGEVQMLLDSQ
jgi:hypothetical protein